METLPKEFKEEVKETFARPPENEYEQGYDNALVCCFGIHNLTSDAEEEEMLYVSRKRVQDMYAANERIKVDFLDKETSEASDHINHVLRFLFGSKCLPEEPSLKSGNEEPKFKYKEGDKVVRYCDKKTYVVVDYCEDDNVNQYIIVDALGNRYSDSEGNLKLYEGPKYCVGQKVRYKGQNHEIGEIAKYWGDEDPGRYSVRFGSEYHNISEGMLDPYEEPKPAKPTKAKYHKGEKVYLHSFGKTMLAKRKSDGKIIEVFKVSEDRYQCGLQEYEAEELDFLSKKETAVLEGWVLATKTEWRDSIIPSQREQMDAIGKERSKVPICRTIFFPP